jgi:hypothetical protein
MLFFYGEEVSGSLMLLFPIQLLALVGVLPNFHGEFLAYYTHKQVCTLSGWLWALPPYTWMRLNLSLALHRSICFLLVLFPLPYMVDCSSTSLPPEGGEGGYWAFPLHHPR